jgi:hypothetical protein
MPIKEMPTPRTSARRAFGLSLQAARALWQTPEGEWVVVTRGRVVPFALSNLTEWDGPAVEGDTELTADAAGRVLHRGRPVALGDRDWVVPLAVRDAALA